ncbi:hypothetical protein [Leptolyngbya ohadii]|uniref:hypothetical protein n=1 Tax=Leptolyngbya ohadii TaxID=1962290 RepID=UPI0019D4DC68|nr:hypothetical protein [Leptolyngbya ohadii]
MQMPFKVAKSIASGLTGMSLIAFGAVFVPAQATQQLSCTGRMNNGWTYDAKFLNGRFTQITWNRAGQPPQVSTLTFYGTNPEGQPIYRGAFQAATAVTLVDLGKGNVRPGSQVSVGVEEWGWSRGTCTASTGGGGTGTTDWFTSLRQDLMGVNGDRSREWMRANGFFFIQTMEHTNTQVVERWNRSADNAIVDVVIATNSNVVTDVRRIR